MLPSVYMGLERQEKAFVIACIDLDVKRKKEEARKAKKGERR
jgi:hypothetical protein